jgi:hypothetical protein
MNAEVERAHLVCFGKGEVVFSLDKIIDAQPDMNIVTLFDIPEIGFTIWSGTSPHA